MTYCKECSGEIVGRRSGAIFCSVKCNRRATGLRRAKRPSSEKQSKNPDVRKNARLLSKYGISLAEWEEMFARQGNCCGNPGCKATEHGGSGWHTDHDHATGAVRGILCHSCNLMLGNARDNLDVLEGAVVYLLQSVNVFEKAVAACLILSS